MKSKILILLLTIISLSLYGQNDNPRNLKFGLLFTLDNNLSSESFASSEYIGYSANYNETNYRIGLSAEYSLRNGFSLNSGINYSNKDFTGTYYCAVCDIIGPINPEKIELRFIEIPLSLRYYFLPKKLKVYGEIGINNQFVLSKETIDNSFILGLKFGGGIEYSLNQKIAVRLLTEYNKGVTNLFEKSDFKIDYLSFGIGISKRI